MLTLHYKEFGQGPPIIILHGLFGTLDNWQTIAKKLSENHTVFIIDQRNHGRSPHLNSISYDELANDLLHFMEQNWIHSAILIGHSMGGKTVMEFTMQYPEKVNQLIVVDIAPIQYDEGHEDVFEAIDAINLETLEDRKDAELILNQKLNNEQSTVQFLLKNLSRDPDTGLFEWKMNYSVLKNQYSEILKPIEFIDNFDRPTFFIRGSKSKYIKDDYWHTILQYFPTAELITIEDAGHWVHAEKPVEFTKALLKILD